MILTQHLDNTIKKIAENNYKTIKCDFLPSFLFPISSYARVIGLGNINKTQYFNALKGMCGSLNLF